MKTIFMNMKNSKTNESHKFVLNLSQILDLRRSDKHVALQNLSIYYTWKNIRRHYKNNKLKIIALKWNDEFGIPDGFYSVWDIKDYIKYISKKYETLIAIPLTHIYINRTNNRLVFKTEGGYKLELQTPEEIDGPQYLDGYQWISQYQISRGSTIQLIEKTKNVEKVPILEVVEVVLVQCILVDNQYQQ